MLTFIYKSMMLHL